LFGPIVNEARAIVATDAVWGSWLTQVTRLWSNAATFDIESTVGPIPLDSKPRGREVVVRYSTDLVTNATWRTDSNCRDMIERIRDYRASWNYTVYEPIAGNYVPVNCRITTADVTSGVELSVSTDRTQGGSSINDGELELMVHRRLQMDDRRGVGEPMNESGLNALGDGLIVRSLHRLSIAKSDAAAALGKATVQDLLFPPSLTFSPLGSGLSPASWLSSNTASFTGLAKSLPPNIHLLTLQSYSPSTVLVRLAHLFETGEGGAMSSPVSIDLSSLLAASQTPLTACVERTTPGAKNLADVKTITVMIEGEGSSTYPTLPLPPAGDKQTIVLNPMDIRTFVCSC
jgi:hypothetical protein